MLTGYASPIREVATEGQAVVSTLSLGIPQSMGCASPFRLAPRLSPSSSVFLLHSWHPGVGVVYGWHLATGAGRQGVRRLHVESGEVEQEARIKEKQWLATRCPLCQAMPTL